MARETIATTDVEREAGYLYFIKGDGNVYKAPLKKPGQPKGKQSKAADTGVELDYSKYMYFVGTKAGKLIVERTERQVGGSKRAKKGGGGAAKKGAKKGTAKKTSSAKKTGGGKKGGKKGKKK